MEARNIYEKRVVKIVSGFLAAVIVSGVIVSAGSRNVLAAVKTMPDGTLFDPEYYAQANPDVAAALGDSEEMLYYHYQMAGKAEGRPAYAGDTGSLAAKAQTAAAQTAAATQAAIQAQAAVQASAAPLLTTVPANHSIGMTGINNARELGGYVTTDGHTVKPGLLLRSGKLSNAKAEDINRLQTVYNLGGIIDLRTISEIKPYRDPSVPGVLYYHVDILDDAKRTAQYDRYYGYMAEHPDAGAGEMLGMLKTVGIVSDDMYIKYLTQEPGITGYRNFFQILLNTPANQSVIFHCSSGKDRTGVAAMLILGVLGCSDEVIMQDFLLTNSYSGRASSGRATLAAAGLSEDQIGDMLVTMDGVNSKHMQNALNFIHANYGTITGYVKTVLGYSDADIARLKAKYLQ